MADTRNITDPNELKTYKLNRALSIAFGLIAFFIGDPFIFGYLVNWDPSAVQMSIWTFPISMTVSLALMFSARGIRLRANRAAAQKAK